MRHYTSLLLVALMFASACQPHESGEAHSDEAAPGNDNTGESAGETGLPGAMQRSDTLRLHFDSFADFARVYRDYDPEVLQDGASVRIRLTVRTFSTSAATIRKQNIKRALVYGAVRAFIHTPATQADVLAVMRETAGEGKLLPEFTGHLATTKERASAVAHRYLGVTDLTDLVALHTSPVRTEYQWSKPMDAILMNGPAAPATLDMFYEALKM